MNKDLYKKKRLYFKKSAHFLLVGTEIYNIAERALYSDQGKCDRDIARGARERG